VELKIEPKLASRLVVWRIEGKMGKITSQKRIARKRRKKRDGGEHFTGKSDDRSKIGHGSKNWCQSDTHREALTRP